MYAIPPDPVATGEALKFFDWAYKNGGKMAASSTTCRCRTALIKQVRATWKAQIKGAPAMASASAATKRM